VLDQPQSVLHTGGTGNWTACGPVQIVYYVVPYLVAKTEENRLTYRLIPHLWARLSEHRHNGTQMHTKRSSRKQEQGLEPRASQYHTNNFAGCEPPQYTIQIQSNNYP
jgi:hypothetical protein